MRNYFATLLLAGLAISAAAAAQDADPIAVLKSGAPFEQKSEACRALSVSANKDAIPVLAGMLTDEQLAHMARYALEPMPYPEVNGVLRDALSKTTGRLQVGVISSLGFRKDHEAVPALIALLPNGDPLVAQAAASALGAIGGAEVMPPLQAVVAQANAPAGNRLACCDALLACAERLQRAEADDSRRQAHALFTALFNQPDLPKQVRAAALRGQILCLGAAPWQEGGEDALAPLAGAIRGEDKAQFDAALRAARELKRKDKIVAGLAEALPGLTEERKVKLLALLGELGGAAAGPAVMAEAKEGAAEVRVAAVNALARMDFRPAVDLIAQLACAGEDDVVKAARNALCYFPGRAGEAAIKAMLASDQAPTRLAGVELTGQGGLDKPAGVLMPIAKSDNDEAVRVAALRAMKEIAGMDDMDPLLAILLKGRSDAEVQAAEGVLSALCERQKRRAGAIAVTKALYGDLPDGPSADVTEQVANLVKAGAMAVDASNAIAGDPAPGRVKRLRVDYTDNDSPVSKSVKEGETLKLTVASAPPAVMDALGTAFENAQGAAKLAALRLLGGTGNPKALETVRVASASEDAGVKDTALRTLCDWPNPDALAALADVYKTCSDPAIKTLALRGTARLLITGGLPAEEALGHFSALMAQAQSPEEKKIVLAGLAQLRGPAAFETALAQLSDESVKTEAVQAAVSIARGFGKAEREDAAFFNGTDLSGWQGTMKYWRVEDGAIVAQSNEPPTHNEFLWSGVESRNFYLAVDVLIEPNTGNGGVQLRSKKVDERGQALGYQADIGQEVWGRLYHEHGRGKLDWTDRAERAVKPGEWNHLEILAIGPAIWTAINGTLGVACLDIGSEERAGLFALQLHAGIVQTIRYRITRLIHDPELELGSIPAESLISELRSPEAK